MSFPFPNCSNRGKQAHQNNDLRHIRHFEWSHLTDQDVIGSGSFGTVLTAKYKGSTMVIKKLLDPHDRNRRLFFKEATILNALDDNHVVKFHALCQSPPAMMLEFMHFDFSPYGMEGRVTSLKGLLEH